MSSTRVFERSTVHREPSASSSAKSFPPLMEQKHADVVPYHQRLPPPQHDHHHLHAVSYPPHHHGEGNMAAVTKEQDAIYGHTLFPLLALLLGKCDLATWTSRQGGRGGTAEDVCSSLSFDDDISAFAEQVRTSQKLFSCHPELDHLVHELCDNFCARYASCLKGNTPIDLVIDDEDNHNLLTSRDDDDIMTSFWKPPLMLPGHHSDNGRHAGNGVGESVASPSTGDNDGGCDVNDERHDHKKRGVFPEVATNILRAWLFQHLVHPYPCEDEKKQLSHDTGLSILQVNNWFINARRRIVQPILDQNNRVEGQTGPHGAKGQPIRRLAMDTHTHVTVTAPGVVGGVAMAMEDQWHCM
ncbi:homeobox protein Meis1a isoform X2 [Phyllopteryx taeniolatus]|uniref:homeobox protein Meis1a isoform X2 n=1 Tax=Phyllopteryx taeniolatus TaxID=161469 RepID=UPI002AD22B48|nr:homeobox protein Meis1a isoform X2 [Phyllopteryx taeniolatus]